MGLIACIAAKFAGTESQTLNNTGSPKILREDLVIGSHCRIGEGHIDYTLAFWQDLRTQFGNTPDWSEFRPFDHPAILPCLMLFAKIDGRFNCSLVGEEANTILPVKIAGRFIDEVMPHSNAVDMSHRFNLALDTGEPNFVEKTMAWQEGYEYQIYQSLQLPFSGESPRVLCVTDFQPKKRSSRVIASPD